jgi:glycerophosphoryl diester phosphodiesterase
VIEIKAGCPPEPVGAAIREARMANDAIAISFHDAALAAVRTLEPRLACGLLVGGLRKGRVARRAQHLEERARQCGASVLDLHYPVLSAGLVAELHRRGLAVWCWTVNDAATMSQLAAWGVNAITTDHPDVMVQTCPRALRVSGLNDQ